MSQSHEQRERAKRIIYAIIRQLGDDCGKEGFVEAAFYYAHVKFAADHPGYLSTWPIVKTPHGPGIADEEALLNEIWSGMLGRLSTESALQIGDVEIAGQVADSFLVPNRAADNSFTEAEVAAIRWGVEMTKKSAARVDSRAWRDAPLGEELSIYTDLLPDDDYARRMASAEASARALSGMWRGIGLSSSPPQA